MCTHIVRKRPYLPYTLGKYAIFCKFWGQSCLIKLPQPGEVSTLVELARTLDEQEGDPDKPGKLRGIL